MTPPPGLIALWRGETNATDIIGGNHGKFYAGTTVTVSAVTNEGKVGRAFVFDGTVHIRIDDSAALEPAQLTAETWVRPTQPSGGFQAILARGSSRNEDDTWYLGLLNGTPQFWSHGQNLLQCPFAIPPDEWTHLAITYDGLTKRLYVNGTQVGARDEALALIYDAAPVTIASDWASGASNSRFNGRIDEPSLYNRALTAEEVLSIYNADFAGKDFTRPYFRSPSQLSDGELGHNYAQRLVAVVGSGPLAYSHSTGALPPGLGLAANGLVSGVSTLSGTFEFTARATDTANMFSEQACRVRIVG